MMGGGGGAPYLTTDGTDASARLGHGDRQGEEVEDEEGEEEEDASDSTGFVGVGGGG